MAATPLADRARLESIGCTDLNGLCWTSLRVRCCAWLRAARKAFLKRFTDDLKQRRVEATAAAVAAATAEAAEAAHAVAGGGDGDGDGEGDASASVVVAVAGGVDASNNVAAAVSTQAQPHLHIAAAVDDDDDEFSLVDDSVPDNELTVEELKQRQEARERQQAADLAAGHQAFLEQKMPVRA